MDASSLSSQATHGLLLKSEWTEKAAGTLLWNQAPSQKERGLPWASRRHGGCPASQAACYLNDWHVAAQQPSRLAVCTEPRTKQAIKRQRRSSRCRLQSPSRWRRDGIPGLATNIKAVCHPGLDVWDLSGQRLASHTAGYKVSLKRKQTLSFIPRPPPPQGF